MTLATDERIAILEEVLEKMDECADMLRRLNDPRIQAYCLADFEGRERGWLGTFVRDILEEPFQGRPLRGSASSSAAPGPRSAEVTDSGHAGLQRSQGRRQPPPLLEGDFCLMHSPEHAEEMAEARRLGGLRRRREKAVSGAYDFDGPADVGQVRRLLEVAALDTLSLENSVARSRTLAYLAQVALKALEVGELAERIEALERLVAPRLPKAGKRR